MTNTHIRTDIDFEADGRQTGFLRLSHSVHDSAYGWIPVPVVVMANGPGPTVLLIAGNHGDEYEAQIALTRLCQELQPDDIKGRLIILTMANYPAAEAGSRTSPIDGGNLNRSFPGDPNGTPTQAIAHYIEEVLLPRCDFCFDLHSGGTSLVYLPTLLRLPGHTVDEAESLDALQQAFDLPYTWIFDGGGGPGTRARTAMGAASRKGVICVMAELAGGGDVSPAVLAMTERGLRGGLHQIGVLPGHLPEPPRGTRAVRVEGSVYAEENGVFEPLKELADQVCPAEEVGLIHHPDKPWAAPDRVLSSHGGLVLCRRAIGRVRRGDALYQIASDRPS